MFAQPVLLDNDLEDVLSSLNNLGISIPDPKSVRKYLTDHQDMINLIPFVCKKGKNLIEDNMELSLEVHRDMDDEEYLMLYVRSDCYDDQVLNVIRDVETVYSEKLIGKSGWFIVSTDFKKPGK